MTKAKIALYGTVLVGLGAANILVATGSEARTPTTAESSELPGSRAAWWGNYHWHKSNYRVYVDATNREAKVALATWHAETDLALSTTTEHLDISALRGAYGWTGWRGLASITLAADKPHCNGDNCEITHCHASLNTSYTGSSWRYRGTYCMEFGHCFGLAHDKDRGCMNSGAMNDGLSNTPSPANISAINQRY